ncbi:MAG: hypothetical protein ACFCVC_02690 [Acidimicrobiia bacterium]
MKLEDLARNAADDANAAGRSMPIVPLERSRRRRVLLTVVPTIAAGALAWVVIALVAFPENVEPPVISQVPTTTTTVAETTTTTVTETTTTTIATTATTIAATDIEPGWVRSSFTSTTDNSGEVLSQYTAGINYGRSVAWDRTTRRGIVVVTEESLEWHQPGGITGHANIELGPIVTVESTPTGPVVALRIDDGSIIWYDLATGTETSPPVEPVTTDGITYTVGVRTATIDQPNWSDVPTGEGGELLDEFDPPELVITEDGSEVLRITIGTTDRPYVRIDAYDGRRVIVVAEPLEPALPPMTAWIIDLECPDCTELIETDGAEWFDLTGFLASEGDVVDPVDSDAEAGLKWDIGIIVSIDVDSDGQVRMDYDRAALCNGCSSLDLTEPPTAAVGNTDAAYYNENPRLRSYPVSESVVVTVISPEWLETSCDWWSGGADAGEPIWEAASIAELLSELQSFGRIGQTALTFDADGIVTAIQVGGGC